MKVLSLCAGENRVHYLDIFIKCGPKLGEGASGQNVVELGLVSSPLLLPSLVELLSLPGCFGHVHWSFFTSSLQLHVEG